MALFDFFLIALFNFCRFKHLWF